MTVYDVHQNCERLALLLERWLLRGNRVAIFGLKKHLAAFPFPLVKERLEIYDIPFPEMKVPQAYAKAKVLIEKVLPRLSDIKLRGWHKAAACAAVVYESIQRRGVYVGLMPRHPEWSMDTYSGRSKTLGFNIQGATKDFWITNPAGTPEDAQIHFDWIGADARMAALLSGDDRLLGLSESGDPYASTADFLNEGSDDKLDRSEVKIALLAAINSMDSTAHILDPFPDLRNWIRSCRFRLDRGKSLESVLGRRYKLLPGRKDLSVFNATMQGSIAHAMQLSIRRIWEQMGNRVLAEVHDSIIVTSARSKAAIKSTIDDVARIMTRPFAEVLEDDPRFMVRVSIGTRWKKWKEYKVVSS